jgi:hypothetical protein
MTIDFSAALLDLKGVQLRSENFMPLMNGAVHAKHPLSGNPLFERTQSEPVTLRSICVDALLANYPDEQGLTGSKKMERFKLADRISSGGTELKAEELAELKALIAKGFGVLAVGRAYALLDPVETS